MDQYEKVEKNLNELDWRVLTGQLSYKELQQMNLNYSILIRKTIETSKYVQQLIREARGDT